MNHERESSGPDKIINSVKTGNAISHENNITSFVRTGETYWNTDELSENIETHWGSGEEIPGAEQVLEGVLPIKTDREHSQPLPSKHKKSVEAQEPNMTLERALRDIVRKINQQILKEVDKFSKTKESVGSTPELSIKDKVSIERRDRKYGNSGEITGGKMSEFGFIDIFFDEKMKQELVRDVEDIGDLEIRKTDRKTDEEGKVDYFLRMTDPKTGRELVLGLDITFNEEKIPTKAAQCASFNRQHGVASDYVSFREDNGRNRHVDCIPVVEVPLLQTEGESLIVYAKAYEQSLLLAAKINELEGRKESAAKIIARELSSQAAAYENNLNNLRTRVTENNIFYNFIEDVIYQLERTAKISSDRQVLQNTTAIINRLRILKSKIKPSRSYTAEARNEEHSNIRKIIEKAYLA